jgi:cytochrome c-type protein NapC
MLEDASWLGLLALGLSAIAAALIVGYLWHSPALTGPVKLRMFFALGVFPTSAALFGNASNLETTKTVQFCGSCHVMDSYVADVRDPSSKSLASMHGRLETFREDACYACHADYGMYGGVTTKINGMHHVVAFYGEDWSEPGHRAPALYEPYDTQRCTSCHDPLRVGAPLEHRVHEDKLRAREISCAANGCHGPPHPAWVQTMAQ